MPIFEISENEIIYLKKKDKIFARYIDLVGPIERKIIPELFPALIYSILGQQISAKALETVWTRIQAKIGELTPESVALYSHQEIQSCGITMKKARYIKEISEKIISGEVNLEKLHQLSDEEVVRQMSQLNGIGVWTAEMIMIFSMQRKNIFSFNDLAIHRGLRIVYKHKIITKELFRKYHRRYSPYASIASLYLWKIAAGGYELQD